MNPGERQEHPRPRLSFGSMLGCIGSPAVGPWERGLPRPWAPLPGELLGGLLVTSAACKDVWGDGTAVWDAAPQPWSCLSLCMRLHILPQHRPTGSLCPPHAQPTPALRSPVDTSRAKRQQSPRSRSSDSSRMAQGGQRGGCLSGHRQGFKSSWGWRLVPVTRSVPQCLARSVRA